MAESTVDSDVRSELFGRTGSGAEVHRWTLRTPGGAVAAVLTRGATLQSWRAADGTELVVGLADVPAYEASTAFFGATVGRVANRIAGGRFTVDGVEHHVPTGGAEHALHGGVDGFDRRVWEAERVPGETAVRFHLTSPDGDMGFPGTLSVQVTYALTDVDGGAELRLDYRATTDAATPVALTNHAYLNVDGVGSGSVERQRLRIAAGRYLPVDAGLIPLGELAPVAGTPFDFTAEREIGAHLRDADAQLLRAQGYDHCWVFDEPSPAEPVLVAELRGTSGRLLQVLTDQPAVQFYSGNFLDAATSTAQGLPVRQADALCLETQALPDAVNQPAFGDVVLRPGQEWLSTTVMRVLGPVG
ncbi:galactose-1-epimerase [Modestobacter sp. I12A-02628]|uniref:Aldose 1-epimerase n=1 Tax=Goekera deserti TaxID=2497753 RepID=A0A7K3WCU5_9ACTN|nr:aldose epimerase family protein [Goekera deserti]MPQ97038.1 galactose-1-epimerase [Goekera deserti]NDI46645.1 galactose-1-epimerase [Goekera deserti]NEL54214.1 galactose mutarotase [Goekera deserti]